MSGPPGGQQGQSTIADAEPSGPGTEMETYCDLSAMGKENAAAVQLSRYIKDRVPARSALRKSLAPGAEDGMKSLLSNFNALQETMAHFNQDSSRRRESLTGKEGATGIEKDNPPVAQKASTLASNPAANASAPAPTGLQHRPPLNRPPLPLPPAPSRAMQCETSQDQGMDLDDSQQGTDAASSTHTMVCIPAAIASTKHGKAAIDLFLDPLLTKALHDILNRRLQRTKDGATDKTRIQELAELVRLLRKVMREVFTRINSYVEQCGKVEKEHAQQVEAAQLSHAAALCAVEAELAAVRQSHAELEKDFKSHRANWCHDVDVQRAEVSRLKRELERVTEERDKAREEGKKADQARVQLECEVRELRRVTSAQTREWAASQGEAVRLLSEEKTVVEARLAALTSEHERLTAMCDKLCACDQEQQQMLHHLRAEHDNTLGQCKAKDSQLALADSKLAKLQHEAASLLSQLEVLQAERVQLAQHISDLQADRLKLESEASSRGAMLADMQTRLGAVGSELEVQREEFEQQIAEAQASIAALSRDKAALLEERCLVKASYGVALEAKERAEASVATLQQEKAVIAREVTNLHNQVEFATEAQAEAEQACAAANQRASELQAALGDAKSTSEQRQARLQHLEDELGALQEVLGESGGQRDVVQRLLAKVAGLQGAVATAEATRRRLHNELVEVRGNIRVYCRVRPHLSPAVRCLPDQTSVVVTGEGGKEASFGYDRVFGPTATQDEIFASVSELVQSALDGYHVCLFSYGQTGAGKTHTMQGCDNGPGRGIIPRAVDKILQTAVKLRGDQEWEYAMEASFIEVYNNNLRDLLAGPSASYIADQNAIKHDPDGGHTLVQGVNRFPVQDSEGASELIRRAAASRMVESTAMNATSSRSHSVFMLYISGWHAPSSTRLQGCLCLVDLAGSERLDRSLAEDQRKKEACAINQSLSALGDVFASLSSRSSHVPYRNSKLTYLLQPCLGGHGKTLMFVNINPEPASAGESLCSLRFAAKVSGCETGAKGGAKRHVMTGGGGDSSTADAGSKRMSMLPSVGAGTGSSYAPSTAAADKRMSLAMGPSRGGGAGMPGAGTFGGGAADSAAAKRMSMAGVPRSGAGGGGGVERGVMGPPGGGGAGVGQKRTAGSQQPGPAGGAKRVRPQ